jgi:FkbM family methyltransferase
MNNKLLIEVGAYDGSNSLKYYNNGYTVYTFEPNKICYNYIKNKTSHLLNYNVINNAVCLYNGETEFNICKEGGASSLLNFKSDSELNNIWKNREDIHYSGNSYKVETIRLDTFIENYNLQNKIIDYIHIDAQGVDLDVLKSLGKYIKNFKEGFVEIVIDISKTIYINQTNNYIGLKLFLEENNFRIYRVEQNDKTMCEYNVYFKNNIYKR